MDVAAGTYSRIPILAPRPPEPLAFITNLHSPGHKRRGFSRKICIGPSSLHINGKATYFSVLLTKCLCLHTWRLLAFPFIALSITSLEKYDLDFGGIISVQCLPPGRSMNQNTFSTFILPYVLSLLQKQRNHWSGENTKDEWKWYKCLERPEIS